MVHLKWGVLSTANIGKTQVIPAIQRSKNGEVVAIASRNKESAKQAAEELNIPHTFDSYQALLQDTAIDAVYIPLPNGLHKEWVIEAAKHKKHILCEKPIGINQRELDEMMAACEVNDVQLMEAFMYQYHPQHEKVKQLINDDVIGKISFARSSFAFYLDDRSNIRLNHDLGGGAMYDIGCYTIHAMRNMLDAEPVTVYASGKYDEVSQVDTTMSGVLTFADGIIASFDCSFDTLPRQVYEFVGSKGKIEVTSPFRPDVNENMAGEIIVTTDNGEVTTHSVSGDQYTLMVEDFASAIIENHTPLYTTEQMTHQMKTLDAVYKSSQTGERVIL
ncbi:oxidoreductase [Gracilibacillus halophilus YIM-C55.5]|uniref:Oxidoreductase n=1 Tax=Gracilibacillus halophilus YIM-C55.5 TaxID=1308866 RepID=N4WQH2_9BACI|nr:Gfo/Idh/MocA family oxidoreductase [Gracilibacillus halophilus]ENH98377.1 oxidoreductase [Gracilibacillus halophilus YIM-C55.5]